MYNKAADAASTKICARTEFMISPPFMIEAVMHFDYALFDNSYKEVLYIGILNIVQP